MKVKFKKFKRDAQVPERAEEGSVGYDLRTTENLIISPDDILLVDTGIAIELPPGIEGQIRPRSGLAAKHGITVVNTPGTIDPSFRGSIKVALINLGDETFRVNSGDKIAQLIFNKVELPELIEVDELSETERGEGGFGSTDKINHDVDNTNNHCDNCDFCDFCEICEKCDNCDFCRDCKSCSYCRYCKHCEYCPHCFECDNCADSIYCVFCLDCYQCDNCHSCCHCSSCVNCTGLKNKTGWIDNKPPEGLQENKCNNCGACNNIK